MALQVRRLTGKDAPAFRDVRLHALETFPHAFLTTAEEFRARPLSAHAQALEAGKTWGVFLNETLVGMAAFLPLEFAAAAHRAEIGAFYVLPEHHGTGAADALMAEIAAKAKSAGIWQLELFVADDNPRALRFYARHGFCEQGRLPNAALMGGKMTSDIFMTVDLR